MYAKQVGSYILFNCLQILFSKQVNQLFLIHKGPWKSIKIIMRVRENWWESSDISHQSAAVFERNSVLILGKNNGEFTFTCIVDFNEGLVYQ